MSPSGGIHSAFDLAPIAWIETGLRTKVAQGEVFLKTQGGGASQFEIKLLFPPWMS